MALKKYAFVKLASVIATEQEFNDTISKVAVDDYITRKVVKYNPEFVYARFKAIGCMEVDGPNANADGFPYGEFLDQRAGYGYQSFIGKHAFIEHSSNNINNSIGDLYGAYLNRFNTGKFGNKEWPILSDDERSWVLANRGQHEDGSIEVLMAVDRKLAPKIARMLETNSPTACSMGTNIDYSECTICGTRAYVEEGYCPHIKFSKGQHLLVPAKQIADLVKKGTLRKEWLPYVLNRSQDIEAVVNNTRRMVYAKAFEVNYGLSFFELSVVANPAFNRGYKLEKIAKILKPSFHQLMPLMYFAQRPVEIVFNVAEDFYQDVLNAYAAEIEKPLDQWTNEEKLLFERSGEIAKSALQTGNVQEVLTKKRNAPYLVKANIELIPSNDAGFYKIANPDELFNQVFAKTRLRKKVGVVGTLEENYYSCMVCEGVYNRETGKKCDEHDWGRFEKFSICSDCDRISKSAEDNRGEINTMDKKQLEKTKKIAEYPTLPTTTEFTGDKPPTEGNSRDTETKLYKDWAEKGSSLIEKEKEYRPMGTIFIDAIVARKDLNDRSARIAELSKSAKTLLARTKLALDAPEDFLAEMGKDKVPEKDLESPNDVKGVEDAVGPEEVEEVEGVAIAIEIAPGDLRTTLENTKADLEMILSDLEHSKEMVNTREGEAIDALANKLRWGRRLAIAAQKVAAEADTLIEDAASAVENAVDKLQTACETLYAEEGKRPEKKEENLESNEAESNENKESNNNNDDEESNRDSGGDAMSKDARLELNVQNIQLLRDLKEVVAGSSVPKTASEDEEQKVKLAAEEEKEEEVVEEKKEEVEEKKEASKTAEAKIAEAKEATAQPPTGARDPGDYGDPGGIESFEMKRWWQDMYPEFEKMKAKEEVTELNEPSGKVELLTGFVGTKSPDTPEVGKQTNVPAIFAKRFANAWEPKKTFYGIIKVAEDDSVEGFTANFADVTDPDAGKEYFDAFTSDAYLDEVIDTVKAQGVEATRKLMNGRKIAQLEGITPGKTEKVNPLYDAHEDRKDSNAPRESFRPDPGAGHGKGEGEEKTYYAKAYGDEGYASDLVKSTKKVAELTQRVADLEMDKKSDVVAKHALHLARVAASRGIVPFDLSSIKTQAMEYIKYDEKGIQAVKSHLEKLPVVDQRALEAYQIPEAENMSRGVVHNSLDVVDKVRMQHTDAEDVAPDGIQPAVENNAKVTAEQTEQIRKKAADAQIVPQVYTDSAELAGEKVPDVTKFFTSTIENRLKRAGKYDEYKHLLHSNRRQ